MVDPLITRPFEVYQVPEGFVFPVFQASPCGSQQSSPAVHGVLEGLEEGHGRLFVVGGSETNVGVIHKGVAHKRECHCRQDTHQGGHMACREHAGQKHGTHQGPDEWSHAIALKDPLDGEIACRHVGFAAVSFIGPAVARHNGVRSVLEGGEQRLQGLGVSAPAQHAKDGNVVHYPVITLKCIVGTQEARPTELAQKVHCENLLECHFHGPSPLPAA